MRELILRRIQEIREGPRGNDFSKGYMRWSKRVEFDGVHISKVDFDSLSDEKLMEAFELIHQRSLIQM